MKKRWLILTLILLLLLGGTYWGMSEVSQDEDDSPYVLYFQERDLRSVAGGSALGMESAQLPGGLSEDDTLGMAKALMADLLDGPRDETLKNTIPAGTSLVSITLEGSRLVVDLSTPYSTLSGVALTMADQAIALTLTQLPDVISVRITVWGRDLAYREKQIFTGREVLLAPMGDVVSTIDVVLYFPDQDGNLVPEERKVTLYEGDTQVSAVAQAVEAGPENKNLVAVWPEGFRVRSVWLEENICYVNLSSSLIELLPQDSGLQLALEALARSLCSLPAVQETQFLVDGEFAKQYGNVNVEQPFS